MQRPAEKSKQTWFLSATNKAMAALALGLPSIGVVADPSLIVNGGALSREGLDVESACANCPGVSISGQANVQLVNSLSIVTRGLLSDGVRVFQSNLDFRYDAGGIPLDDLPGVIIYEDGSYGVVAAARSNVRLGSMGIFSSAGPYYYSATRVHGAHAIVAETESIISLDGLIRITTLGDFAGGLLAQGAAEDEIFESTEINTGAEHTYLYVSTLGTYSPGVETYGPKAARINIKAFDIFTTGFLSYGVAARGGLITLQGGNIRTEGESAHGLFATDFIEAFDISIATSGLGAKGVVAKGGGVSLFDSGISTRGRDSEGIRLLERGKFNGLRTYVFTTGENSSAVWLQDESRMTINYGTLNASGWNSPAITLQGWFGHQQPALKIYGSSAHSQQAETFRLLGATADIEISASHLGSGAGALLKAESFGGHASVVNVRAVDATLAGNIEVERGSIVNLVFDYGVRFKGGMRNVSAFEMQPASLWEMSSSSELDTLILNGGTVRYQVPAPGFRTLAVRTLGGIGGTIGLNAVLNEGGRAAQADQLHIRSNVSGQHSLSVANQGGAGARTVGDGIKLVQVDGQSSASNFALAAPVQAGAYEYHLFQGGSDSEANWYLRSDFGGSGTARAAKASAAGGQQARLASSIDKASDSATRREDAVESPARKLADLGDATAYRPAVPGYVLTPSLNLNYGFETLGRLHERAGDIPSVQGSAGNARGKDAVWGRIGGTNLDAKSGRFEARQDDYFAQFGKDWDVARDAQGGYAKAGATLTLGNANARFEDSARALAHGLSTRSGSLDTQAQGIGGYYTRYWGDGSYVDGVGQVTRFSNKYSDAYGAKSRQDGYAVGLSAEVGRPLALNAQGFAIEPQAQLMYQYLGLDDFEDQVSSVRMDSQDQLRGRIGVRLFSADSRAAGGPGLIPYITVDVLHDFLGPGTTYVGGTAFERGLGETWYELGLGMSGSLGHNSEIYANVKYARNIGGDAMRSVAGKVGYRYSW